MIDLFAITDLETAPLPKGAPLRAVVAGGLTAVCGDTRDEPVTVETLWRHEETVEALMAERDLLPARYGTRFESDDAVARAVREREEQLATALERVRGAVELSVRVHSTEAALPAAVPGSGSDYLKAKIRCQARREAGARMVDEPLRGLARASVRRQPREESELLRAAYLVDRGAVGRFRSWVAALEASNRGLALLCTGPWPVYTFAES